MWKTLFLLVNTVLLAQAEIRTEDFDVKDGKTISPTSNGNQRLQTRSVIECVNKCSLMQECHACSYHRANKTCIVDTTGGSCIQIVDSDGFVTATKKSKALPLRDCSDLPSTCLSGIYTIYPTPNSTFDVYCNMDTDNGGWTVFQRRMDGSIDFYRDWSQYEIGFGDLLTEFWLGNEKIIQITSSGSHRLRIELEDFEGNATYANYNHFSVGDSTTNYTLDVSGYSGTAGNSLVFENGQQFTTFDRDNDVHSSFNCARWLKGAWWYQTCQQSNLNGLYLGGSHASYADGVNWFTWRGYYYSLKTTKMMMKRTV